MFEAKKRYGLSVLNFMVTSNHIHLLVSGKKTDSVSKSIQLIAGRVGQEYNIRKKRKGAFWEDRYHATAIDRETHLLRCMLYIDLNMVRAGVVSHPIEWKFCGYTEITNPKRRYAIIDYQALNTMFGATSIKQLQVEYERLVNQELNKESCLKEPDWSSGIAVGRKVFVSEIQSLLGVKADKRKVEDTGQHWVLQEPKPSYS